MFLISVYILHFFFNRTFAILFKQTNKFMMFESHYFIWYFVLFQSYPWNTMVSLQIPMYSTKLSLSSFVNFAVTLLSRKLITFHIFFLTVMNNHLFVLFVGKVFFSKGNLGRHVLLHSGMQPFNCSLCGKSFTQNAHLKRHKTSSHKNFVWNYFFFMIYSGF